MATIKSNSKNNNGNKISKKKLTLIIVSAAVAAVLVVGFIIGLVYNINLHKSVDFMKDDLSKYLYIAESDYKNYPVEAVLGELDEGDLASRINKLLVQHKGEAKFGGAAVKNYPVTLGDVVNLYYRGYTVDEKGIQHDVANASNLTDAKPYELEIGSGSFIPGFEETLIGMSMQATSFKAITEGEVMPGDVIYLSYEAFLPDGTTTKRTAERIDLALPSTNDIYGEGFSKFFLGKTVGTKISDSCSFRTAGAGVDTTYFNLVVEQVTRCEDMADQIVLTFPEDYKEAALRGVEVTFDIFMSTAVIYDTPEWNDSFIVEKLKESAESLAGYEGASLTEKYEKKLIEELELEIVETNKALIEEEMWKHYRSKAVFKKLPQNEVDKIYQEYFNEVKNQYSVYGAGYDSLNAFAKSYFGLSEFDNWRDYITKKAEDVIKEKLIFYYVMRAENLIPSEAEYNRVYDENISEYMKYYETLYEEELKACKTEEERQAKLEEIKQDMIAYYGEEYFEENVYYQYALDFMIGFAAVQP